MIQMQTQFKIIDNTGAKKAQCIKVFKGRTGTIGDIVLVSIKKIKQNLNIKTKIVKGDIFKALIVHTRYPNKKTIGHFIKFDQNSIVLLNEKEQPLGTRFSGPITLDLRKRKKLKIISLASSFV